MATNKSWKDQDGNVKEIAEFHNIVSWNKMAEICQQLLAKGMKVYIEGSLSTRSWEADDGSTRYKTEVRVNDMILLDSKGKQGAGFDESAQEKPEEIPVEEEVSTDDSTVSEDPLEDSDLPF
jgi:single-strand DNA-binding protein